ncbi:MAG TPA: O-antigen ligase family protein, partial [Candidatus Limnocylindrales bacterium]|nr:O-antigen ligase family protein [Candidatus Limnocylindrales bacterium]
MTSLTGAASPIRPPARPAFGSRRNQLLAVVGIVVIAVVVAAAIRLGRGAEALGASAAVLVVLMSFRWPLLPLFLLAALIPFEEAVNIPGVGTLSRYAGLVLMLTYGLPRLGLPSFRAMSILGWLYVAWATLSATWAIDSVTSWTQITPLVLLLGIGVVTATAVADRPSIVRPLLWTYSLSAAATGLVGIANLILAGGVTGQADRVAALAGQDPAFYAAILVPALIFGFYEVVGARWLPITTTIVFVCAVGIIVSGTRSAWISSLIVLALFVFPRLDAIRRLAALVVLAIGAIIVAQIPGLVDLVTDRAASALPTGGAGRTDLWTIGVRIFESSPINGVGIANFPVANTPELARQAPLSNIGASALANFEPHNIAVGTLGELGIVGFMLLAMFLVPLVLRRGWGPDGPIIQTILASLLIVAFFVDMLIRKELWLFIGIASGLAYLARKERGERGAATAAEVEVADRDGQGHRLSSRLR